MGDDTTFVWVDGARATTLVEEIDLQCADEGAIAKPYIAVIERSRFMQDRIRRSMQSAFSLPITKYSTVAELEDQLWKGAPCLVILSLMQGNQARIGTLKVLLELVRTVPVIVLASVDDVDLARTVLRLGAKGYVPVTKGFEIAIEAVRFVLGGRGLSAGRAWRNHQANTASPAAG
jgi:DNA-binding NarL/FixJ family response regulator